MAEKTCLRRCVSCLTIMLSRTFLGFIRILRTSYTWLEDLGFIGHCRTLKLRFQFRINLIAASLPPHVSASTKSKAQEVGTGQ